MPLAGHFFSTSVWQPISLGFLLGDFINSRMAWKTTDCRSYFRSNSSRPAQLGVAGQHLPQASMNACRAEPNGFVFVSTATAFAPVASENVVCPVSSVVCRRASKPLWAKVHRG